MAIFVVLLLAGLWPFDFFPKNNVRWIPDQQILRFGRYGVAYSPKPIEIPGTTLDFRKPVQLEVTIRPGNEPGYLIPRILSICDENSSELFFVGQWMNHLILRLSTESDPSSGSYWETGVDNLFRTDRSVNIGICFNESGMNIFIDGKFVKSLAGYTLSRFSGRRTRIVFLLGNSPAGDNPWEGDLQGISIRQDIPPQREHGNPDGHVADPWTVAGGNIAVVIDNDPSGKTPGMVLRTGTKPFSEILIPSTFRPLKRKILFPPWKETLFNRPFWRDVAINVIGFIPFGFFFYAWRRNSAPGQRIPRAMAVVMLGAGISIAIELLQAILPTRDSSLTDVAANVLGTYVGICLFRTAQKVLYG